jgi:hypothetical protein
VGGAHREGGDSGGVNFKTGEVGRAPMRYDALAWTIGQGGERLRGERGSMKGGVAATFP